MRSAVILIVAVAWILSGCTWTGRPPSESTHAASTERSAPDRGPSRPAVVYVSDKGEILTARFDNSKDTVLLKPPGRTEVELPRAISGSGARYSDGRETFWEHHGEGSYWIGEELIFRGRVKEDVPK